MKTKLILTAFTIATLLLLNTTNSSAQTFSKGQKNLHVGIGLPTFLGVGSKISIPATSVVYEVGIKENFAVGGYLGYTASKFDTFGGTIKYTYSIIGLRGSYHLNKIENIDLYVGGMLGYNIGNSKWKGDSELPLNDVNIGGFAYSAHAGLNYLLSEKAGLFGEIGYGISYLNLGFNLQM